MIRKAVMRGSERGRWKSTYQGNSLAAYSTSRCRAVGFNSGVIGHQPQMPALEQRPEPAIDLRSTVLKLTAARPCNETEHTNHAREI